MSSGPLPGEDSLPRRFPSLDRSSGLISSNRQIVVLRGGFSGTPAKPVGLCRLGFGASRAWILSAWSLQGILSLELRLFFFLALSGGHHLSNLLI